MSEAGSPERPGEPAAGGLDQPLAAAPEAHEPQASQVEAAQISAPTPGAAPQQGGPEQGGPEQGGPEGAGAEGGPVPGTRADVPAGAAPGPPESLHGCPVTQVLGQVTVHTDRARYLGLMEGLYGDGFEACMGVTGVDYLTHPGRELPAGVEAERFEVVVELLSLSRGERLRVRCQVPADEPVVPSLFDLWPGSEAQERETFDMFGIRFRDHPDLTRILMPEDWEGHPLRKDYATGHVPVQFKETPA